MHRMFTDEIVEFVEAEVVVDWTPEYAAEYVSEPWQKAVESIVETGRRLITAQERVGHGNWGRAVELMPFGAETARQLKEIAKHPVLSNPKYICDLPPSWGTLGLLSRLPADKVLSMIDEGKITAELGQVEARELVSSKPKAPVVDTAGNPQPEPKQEPVDVTPEPEPTSNLKRESTHPVDDQPKIKADFATNEVLALQKRIAELYNANYTGEEWAYLYVGLESLIDTAQEYRKLIWERKLNDELRGYVTK